MQIFISHIIILKKNLQYWDVNTGYATVCVPPSSARWKARQSWQDLHHLPLAAAGLSSWEGGVEESEWEMVE